MYALPFYFQIAFIVFLTAISALALYMGIFHAHRNGTCCIKKILSASVSLGVSGFVWLTLSSWTFLGW